MSTIFWNFYHLNTCWNMSALAVYFFCVCLGGWFCGEQSKYSWVVRFSCLAVTWHPRLPGHMSSHGHSWSYLVNPCYLVTCPHLVTSGHNWSQLIKCSCVTQLGHSWSHLITAGHNCSHLVTNTLRFISVYVKQPCHSWSLLVTPGHKPPGAPLSIHKCRL